MYILGISAFYHDSAACIIRDGEIIAAAQEERFSRVKHDERFPQNAIKYCLDEAQILPTDLSYVVFYEKPFLKFERLLETYLAFVPRGFFSFSKSMPLWIKDKLFQKTTIIKKLNDVFGSEIDFEKKLLFSEHHLSHAASAYYPSPFKNAAILTLDGVGEWTTASLSIGNDHQIDIREEIKFPHSIGLLYSAFTYYTGFKVNSGEYKVMGLAPYGEPKYVDKIKSNLINISDDGSFQLDMSYFSFAHGLTMTNSKFHKLFGGLPRQPESEITQKQMDLAASIQKVTEEILISLAKSIANKTGEKNLCLAGGVALNCVANGKLLREKIFDNIWIQPASGDAGGAIGAALAAYHMHFNKERIVTSSQDSMKGSYLGPSFTDREIEETLLKHNAVFHKLNHREMIETVASSLADQKAVGWMQGRMEFGPRALGARSIIADPRSKIMQKQLNLKVKYRESFRPFAPSVLREDVSEWFEHETDSPYMLLVADVVNEKRIKMSRVEKQLFGIDKLNIPRSTVPSITHVDYSARIQTVHADTNPNYHELISTFREKTGCPMLINTSFNVRGEPIVCSPEDAFRCFMGTDLDLLVLNDFILHKSEQNSDQLKMYKDEYELD
jgi:carbamoyltransferase